MATEAMRRGAETLAVPTRRPVGFWEDALYRLSRNRAAMVGAGIVVLLILVAIFAPMIAPYPYDKQALADRDKVPAWMVKVFPFMQSYARISDRYLLGADYVGRDLLSRIIYGTRVSLTVAFVGPLISLIVGTTYGLISGYFGGRLDNIMMRLVDVLYAFPGLLFIILLMVFFRQVPQEPRSFWDAIRIQLYKIDAAFGGMLFIFVGIGLTAWENMARLARGQVLSIREKEFIEAARAIGAGHLRIMFRHILPNIIGPLIVAETLAIPSYITTEAFLSFIGLGVNPPTPSWGLMISQGAQAIRTYPNQALAPALALAITMFAFNFLGDGLRDALDPRMRGTQ